MMIAHDEDDEEADGHEEMGMDDDGEADHVDGQHI